MKKATRAKKSIIASILSVCVIVGSGTSTVFAKELPINMGSRHLSSKQSDCTGR